MKNKRLNSRRGLDTVAARAWLTSVEIHQEAFFCALYTYIAQCLRLFDTRV